MSKDERERRNEEKSSSEDKRTNIELARAVGKEKRKRNFEFFVLFLSPDRKRLFRVFGEL